MTKLDCLVVNCAYNANKMCKRENITVFDYYAPEDFKNLQIDALYMSGGNTFQMMYRLRKHNVVDTIINYINHLLIIITFTDK